MNTYLTIGGVLLVIAIIVLICLPPKYDPAILLKEATDPGEDGRTARERADVQAVNKGVCPDCGATGQLLTGPSGGMSQNILCNACLSEFNVHFSFGNGALGVDRNGKADKNRARVFGIGEEEYRSIVS